MNGEKLNLSIVKNSPAYSSYVCERCIDGSTSTFWYTNSAPAYVIFDVGSNVSLTGFRFYTGTAYPPHSFTISVSDNTESFDDVYSSNCEKLNNWSEYDIETSLVGRYVKITFNGATNSYVREIELYGTTAEPDGPDFDPESTTKYLIRSEDTLFSVVDDELVFLEETELTSDVFHSHGLDELPDWALLMELTNPEVLYWQSDAVKDELPVLRAVLTAIPIPQSVVCTIDLSHPTIRGVQFATVKSTGNPLFACSFDAGLTWKVCDGTDWVDATDGGMNKAALEAISREQWAQVIEGLTNFVFRITLNTVEDTVTSVIIDFINEGE